MTLIAPVIPVIETARLRLRGVQGGDWPAYRAYRLSPRSTAQGLDEGLAWAHFAGLAGHWALKGFGRFVMEDRASGAPIGHVGPYFPDPHPEPELTWTLWDARFEGQGLAQEAARAARDFAFICLLWPTAVSYIDPANARSLRLAERLGARPDAAPASHPGLTTWRHARGAA